jgi:hypothetical protein
MQTKFYYVRDEKFFPMACVCFVRDTPQSLVVKYGWSIFHPGDKFDRTRARAIAESRMMKYGICILVKEPKVNIILKEIFDDLLQKSTKTQLKYAIQAVDYVKPLNLSSKFRKQLLLALEKF